MADESPMHSQLARVRASINLPGLPFGRVTIVDTSDSYVADALERGYLVGDQDATPPSEET